MGTRLTVPGVEFTDYIDIVKYPVTDQLSALFYLGGSGAASKVNQASGGTNASDPGANVTFADYWGVFTGTHTTAANYMQTAELDNASLDLTLIAVSKNAAERAVWGMFNGTGNGAAMLASLAWAVASGSVGKSVAFAGSGLPDAAMQFRALSYTASGGGVMTAYHGAAGSLATSSVGSIGDRVTQALGARIGGGYNASYTGEVLVAAVAKHKKALSAGEIGLIYAYLRSRYAKLGVTVA